MNTKQKAPITNCSRQPRKRLIRRVLRAAIQLAIWLCQSVQRIGGWSACQLLTPALCFGCVYAGVFLTMLMPSSLLETIAPPIMSNLPEQIIKALQFGKTSEAVDLGKALLGALP